LQAAILLKVEDIVLNAVLVPQDFLHHYLNLRFAQNAPWDLCLLLRRRFAILAQLDNSFTMLPFVNGATQEHFLP
jgi:hypothetical protein